MSSRQELAGGNDGLTILLRLSLSVRSITWMTQHTLATEGDNWTDWEKDKEHAGDFSGQQNSFGTFDLYLMVQLFRLGTWKETQGTWVH